MKATKSAKFAQAINDTLDNWDVSAKAKLLYITLLTYGDADEYPTQEVLARRVNFGRRTLSYALSELERAGLVKVYQRGLNRSNHYQLAHLALDDDGTSRWREPRQPFSQKEPIPPDVRWQVWERDNFTCVECGSRQNLAIHHITLECKGGTLALDNLQTLCTPCNLRQGRS